MFSGFYAIVAGYKHDFVAAAIAIFIGMVADSLDGRVARLTNTATAFGAEYDSLSDMLNFGIAPALVAYSWGLNYLGKIGWLIAFFYTAATALRLARFNTQHGVADKRFFVGLPCPAAAAVVAGFIWVACNHGIDASSLDWLLAGVCIWCATLMVSNIPFRSFKEVDLKSRVPFIKILTIVLLFVAVALNPPWLLFLGFLVYSISGPIQRKFFKRRGRKEELAKEENSDDTTTSKE